MPTEKLNTYQYIEAIDKMGDQIRSSQFIVNFKSPNVESPWAR